jgi:SPW repeat
MSTPSRFHDLFLSAVAAKGERRRELVLDVYILSVGLFLAISPLLVAYVHRVASADIWVSGAIVVALSMAAIVAFSEWEEWLNLALGGWLIASPWILGFAHTKAMHIAIGGGVIIMYLAALELWLIHYYDQPKTPTTG